MKTSPNIELQRISKQFGGVRALQDVDLMVPAGATTVLIGPSGCGKSTLLRTLVGLERPEAGEIRIDGAALTPSAIAERRRAIGYVIQEGGLFPHLNARANIDIMARHLRLPTDEIEHRVTELCELTGFPPGGLTRFPLELSGGQRQRVSLMRALMLDPDLLLLDEPLGALDPMIRSDLQRDLRDIFARLHKTVVLVTHDLGEAAYLGDRIVLMKQGRIVQAGPMRALLEDPAEDFVRDFIQAQRSPLEEFKLARGEGGEADT